MVAPECTRVKIGENQGNIISMPIAHQGSVKHLSSAPVIILLHAHSAALQKSFWKKEMITASPNE